MCIYLRIVVANTYCVVFLLCLSPSCVLYVVGFSGFQYLFALSVFSNVYVLAKIILPQE